MKRIKGFLYNFQWDYIGAIILSVTAPIIFDITYAVVIISLAFFYYLINMHVNRKKSKKLHYFHYGYILFSKKRVWLNQDVNKKRDKNKCPQKEFAKELKQLLIDIPDGTICFCCTHELIKDHIIKIYPDANVSEAYKKDLKRLKKKLRNEKCKNCNNENCTLLKSDKTQFYAIDFIKNSTNHH